VASIDSLPDGDPTRGVVYHNTVRPREWWLDTMQTNGMVRSLHNPYRIEDYVRGNGVGLKNWHPDEGTGFHVVLCKCFRHVPAELGLTVARATPQAA
jgi:hypothetical protein